jgi:hypothetical protein
VVRRYKPEAKLNRGKKRLGACDGLPRVGIGRRIGGVVREKPRLLHKRKSATVAASIMRPNRKTSGSQEAT